MDVAVVSCGRNDESANPDKDILAALRPAMATIPNAILLCASSPYARRGEMWNAYRKHYGKDSNVLVWKAATRTMNPSVPQRFIDAAYEDDSASANAEYSAEFRTDVESFISREVVDAATCIGRHELPRIDGVQYIAHIDPSGGSSDRMTLGLCHSEDDRVILDCILGHPSSSCRCKFAKHNIPRPDRIVLNIGDIVRCVMQVVEMFINKAVIFRSNPVGD